MPGPFGSFLGVHLGYHSPECLMYSFDSTVGLWMIGRHPDLGDTQKVTQFQYDLPHKFRCLVGHQSSGKSKHREELIVQDMCCSTCSIFVGDIHLGVACEVVLDDQDILHDRLLFHTHHDLHGHVVDVY